MPTGMVLEGVVDRTSVVVDVISGAEVVVGGGFLQENSLIRSKMVQIDIYFSSQFKAAFSEHCTKKFISLPLHLKVIFLICIIPVSTSVISNFSPSR